MNKLSSTLLRTALLWFGAASLLTSGEAAAQVRHAGAPAVLAPSQLGLPTAVIPVPDLATYRAEDAARGDWPLRYGAMIDVSVSADRDGSWSVAEDGSSVWLTRIVAPGAQSIGLEFTRYALPEGGKLFVYDAQRKTVYGAYTAENRHENGEFAIEPFPGDSLIVEYQQPEAVQGSPELEIGRIVYDYRNVFDLLAASDAAERPVQHGSSGGPMIPVGSCLIDVNCPQGASWNLQKRATVRTLSGGGLCSAALINNTANDATRYILTANHCGQGGNTVFTFNYQTSGCGSGSAPQNQTVSGATLLATNGTYDNRLMRINGAIPANYNPYFAGWTRATTGATFAFALGHPSGGPKKISIDGNGTGISTTDWVVTWSEGTLEGGSSGGPLFDQNGRIRGPACCVNQFTCNQTAFFGRFDRFWTANNIGQWLDPLGTNPTILDGFDPQGVPPAPPTITNVSPNTVNSFGATQVTLTGTNFSSSTQVLVGSTPLTAPGGFTIVSPTTITFTAPTPTSLGPVNVFVTNAVGTSGPASLSYQATHPPALFNEAFAFSNNNYSWNYGGGANHVALLSYSLSPTTFPFAGWPILLNFTTLKVGVLSAVGLGSHTIVLPAAAAGITFYSQVGMLSGATFVGASPVTTTVVFF